MYIYYDEVIQVSLTFLNAIGTSFTRGCSLYAILLIICKLYVALLVLFGLLIDDLNFQYFVELLISVTTLTHTFTKLATILAKRTQIKTLLRNIDYFWPIAGKPGSFNRECFDILKHWRICLQLFRGYTVGCLSFVSVFAVATKNLNFTCHVADYVSPTSFAVFNTAVFDFAACVAIAFDLFVCALLVLLRVQFKILNNHLTTIDYRVAGERYCVRKIKKLVNHHNFLLNYTQRLNEIFGPMLLVYFGTVLFCLCLLLYALLESDNIGLALKYLVYLLGIFVEFFVFYCVPGEFLKNEASKVIGSIYDSNWYKSPYVSVRKSLILIMKRAQKPVEIEAGGMMVVNFETATTVFKTTSSFFTFLKKIRQP